MSAREFVLLVALLLTVSLATATTARPPPSGSDMNGLTSSEVATLWSLDTDSTHGNRSEHTTAQSPTEMRELAGQTDITFKRPPETAATWTQHDFQDLQAGGPETAIFPPHADRANGTYLADAHATLFAIQPATYAHLDPTTTTRYVAPTGSVRGFVDYRIRLPPDSTTGNRSTTWSLLSHDIDTVRLMADDTTIATAEGSHTPVLDYQLDSRGTMTLTLEAEISIRVQRTTLNRSGNQTTSTRVTHSETRTVSDSITVEPYRLEVDAVTTTYPDQSTGLAVFQSQPWQGIEFGGGGERVRGVWRFYTARDPAWDSLVHATDSSRAVRASPAIPVAVHAYPSRVGPRSQPLRNGPRISDTWGVTKRSPAAALGDTIHVDVIENTYTATYGIAVRTTADPTPSTVLGLVRGVNTTLSPGNSDVRDLRESTLTVTILNQTRESATLRITLTDAETGDPIALTRNPRRSPLDGTARTGVITIANKQLRTNATGVAITTITNPGSYTARYQPGSWLDHDPAYVSASTPVRWHPLHSLQGWLALATSLLWQLAPLLVAAYAGKRLLAILTPNTHR